MPEGEEKEQAIGNIFEKKIMKNLEGNFSRVDEAKNQINDLEHKEVKTNQNNKKKKESKNTV